MTSCTYPVYFPPYTLSTVLDFADAGPLMDYDEKTQAFYCRAAGRSTLSVDVARQCLGDLFAALVEMRARGVAHRDIK